MLAEPKFKVGDKVCCLYDNGASKRGQVYTIHKIWYNTTLRKWCIQLVEHLTKLLHAHVHSADAYELVEPNPVLTPEEVLQYFKEKRQYELECIQPNGLVLNNMTEYTGIKYIFECTWRIKPEPEVIELNGKRYKLIEE